MGEAYGINLGGDVMDGDATSSQDVNAWAEIGGDLEIYQSLYNLALGYQGYGQTPWGAAFDASPTWGAQPAAGGGYAPVWTWGPVHVPTVTPGSGSNPRTGSGPYAGGCTAATCDYFHRPPLPPPPPRDCYAGPHPTCHAGKAPDAITKAPLVTKTVTKVTSEAPACKAGPCIAITTHGNGSNAGGTKPIQVSTGTSGGQSPGRHRRHRQQQ